MRCCSLDVRSPALVLVVLFTLTAQSAYGQTCRATSTPIPALPASPGWESVENGFVAPTGLLAVPFRLPGQGAVPEAGLYERDLVVTNGNDLAPQPLSIHYNQKTSYHGGAFQSGALRPEWVSESIGYHGHGAAGDINGDGLIDVAVAIIRDHPDVFVPKDGIDFRPGGIAIYYGVWGRRDGSSCKKGDLDCRPTLERTPSSRILNQFGATSVSLGDVNGDGWLDLAVAVTYTANGLTKLPLPNERIPSGSFQPGEWRIYLSQKAPLKLDASTRCSSAGLLCSESKYFAGDVELADIDQDGRLDLVLAAVEPRSREDAARGKGHQLRIFHGGAGSDAISRTPTWSSTDSYCRRPEDCAPAKVFATSVDTGFLTPDPHASPVVVIGTSCLRFDRACPGGNLLYRPSAGTTAVWRSEWEGWGGDVRLRDLDADCNADLVSAPWFEFDPNAPRDKTKVSTPRVYAGDGALIADRLIWRSAAPGWVAQGIEYADFSCEGIERTETEPAALSGGGRVLTVRDPDLELIQGVVRVDRLGRTTELSRVGSPPEVTWAVGEPWISVSPTVELSPDDKLVIRYSRSYSPDLAFGAWGSGAISVYERPTKEPERNCAE